MTALMILMAVMTVGSDGMERISTATEQHLVIGGYWEGDYHHYSEEDGSFADYETSFRQGEWIIKHRRGFICLATPSRFVDEGQGRCRLMVQGDSIPMSGIYKREAGQLVICLGIIRPITFHCDKGNSLLTLKPAKPPKN
jgi:hypothetical protein